MSRSNTKLRARAVLTGVMLIAGVATGCAQVKPIDNPENSMSSNATQTASANSTSAAIRSPDADLQAQFDYDTASRILGVSYSVRNPSTSVALVVFDRGNASAVAAGRQKFGAVGAPFEQAQGEDVELTHAVFPLRKPTPTVPPSPIAIRVEPGKGVTGRFEVALKGSVAPKRLRWCVGVAPFDTGYLHEPHDSVQGQLWTASFTVVDHQRMLCTPWYDVATGKFES
ncbi:hypothetical protein AZ78_5318 [Lysobacter capsici AZ78]|uniref:Lipoprotein n=1 Tax=Lysobacter capsici AZ78 TaxID=1444315 RepID=A0A125TZV1_9GAMM|nr:hypothetical protein [Lysobacter capsici]KWS02185.1 hypothetical protein AZ78_5318 [Lysobacter capsici AZ78]